MQEVKNKLWATVLLKFIYFSYLTYFVLYQSNQLYKNQEILSICLHYQIISAQYHQRYLLPEYPGFNRWYVADSLTGEFDSSQRQAILLC